MCQHRTSKPATNRHLPTFYSNLPTFSQTCHLFSQTNQLLAYPVNFLHNLRTFIANLPTFSQTCQLLVQPANFFRKPANFFLNIPTFSPNLPTFSPNLSTFSQTCQLFPKPANFYLKIWGGPSPPLIAIYRNPAGQNMLTFGDIARFRGEGIKNCQKKTWNYTKYCDRFPIFVSIEVTLLRFIIRFFNSILLYIFSWHFAKMCYLKKIYRCQSL